MLWICVVIVGFQLTLGSCIQAMFALSLDKACAVALHCSKLWLVDIKLAFLDTMVNFLDGGWVVDHPNEDCHCSIAKLVVWNCKLHACDYGGYDLGGLQYCCVFVFLCHLVCWAVGLLSTIVGGHFWCSCCCC